MTSTNNYYSSHGIPRRSTAGPNIHLPKNTELKTGYADLGGSNTIIRQTHPVNSNYASALDVSKYKKQITVGLKPENFNHTNTRDSESS